jgi:cell division protein FtsW
MDDANISTETRGIHAERSDPPGSGRGAIILVAAALMAIGLVMVGSATVSLDQSWFGPRIWTTPLGRQLIFILCGLGICLTAARLSVPLLGSAACRRWIPCLFFVAAVALLVLVLIPGLSDASHGSQRWLRFNLGGVAVGIQPSEVAKLGLIAFLAYLLGESGRDPRSFFRGFVPASLAIGLCVGLVGKENFGTAALLGCAAGAMLFAAGSRLHHLVVVAGLGVSGMAVLLFAEPYRLARLTAYQNFWNDAQGAGYQPLQSLTTIASGGWWGVGLGSGIQKFGYLPESHTDFVFAVLCEELGVFGGAMVILLFCGFVWLGLRTALRARTRFEFLLAFGLTFIIGMQAAMNIAVVTVMTPTTGVPLPLLSAGGSGLFTVCAAVGLLSAIAVRGCVCTLPVRSRAPSEKEAGVDLPGGESRATRLGEFAG